MKNCVYRFLNKDNEIIYIGKAVNLKNRITNHSHLPKECYNERVKIEFVEFDTTDDMDFAERYYIMKFKPKYNTVLSDKNMNISSMELDIKIWKAINEKDNKEEFNENYIDSFETKENLINKLDLTREKIEFAVSFIRENDIDISDTDINVVNRYKDLLKEERRIEVKLNELLIKEGYSEKIAELFIKSGVYTKEELINKELKKIEDKVYKKCEEDISQNGYYKMKNYYEIEYDFVGESNLVHFYNTRRIRNGLFRCDEIDIEVRKEFTDKIISNIEKRLTRKFGEFKKEVVFLNEGYSDFLSVYADYNAMKFQEPFIIFKPVASKKEDN